MTENERTQIRKKIESTLHNLAEQISTLDALSQPVAPDNSIGRVSRMDAINNRSVNLAALHAARARFSQLEYAQGRLDQPEFGFCTRCKGEIAVPRLLFMPESSRCVNCANRP